MGNHTSDKISKDTTSNLSREEKGVVSSVFAKVIEGAEILEGSLGNIDGKICKNQHQQAAREAGKCRTGTSGGQGTKLSDWFSKSTNASDEWNGGAKGSEPWGEHNAGVVSKDTAALSRGDI